MIQRALIVDCETSGLNPETDRVTEVGAILYSLNARCSLMEFSMLTGHCSDDVIVQALTGITPAAATEILEVGRRICLDGAEDFALRQLIYMGHPADCVVAHNAAFDKQWLGRFFTNINWLCTLEDFRWPGIPANAYSLLNLAITLGVPVVSAHRALTDCRLLAAIFTRVAEQGHDLQALFAVAQRPKATFVALDDGQFFRKQKSEQEAIKQARKQHGFRWDAIVPKAWARRMPVEDTKDLPFEVQEYGR